MKQNIYKTILLAVGLILFAVALYVYYPRQNKLTRITVVGDSQTKVAPDTAVMTFSVVTQAKQAWTRNRKMRRRAKPSKRRLKRSRKMRKPKLRRAITAFSPEQDYYSGKMPKILGYEVKNTVTVSIDDLTQTGAVIDAATKAGANSVEGINFVLGETSPAQGDALSFATKQALAKAESIAQSLGGKLFASWKLTNMVRRCFLRVRTILR